jgi:hypothetical protein
LTFETSISVSKQNGDGAVIQSDTASSIPVTIKISRHDSHWTITGSAVDVRFLDERVGDFARSKLGCATLASAMSAIVPSAKAEDK